MPTRTRPGRALDDRSHGSVLARIANRPHQLEPTLVGNRLVGLLELGRPRDDSFYLFDRTELLQAILVELEQFEQLVEHAALIERKDVEGRISDRHLLAGAQVDVVTEGKVLTFRREHLPEYLHQGR